MFEPNDLIASDDQYGIYDWDKRSICIWMFVKLRPSFITTIQGCFMGRLALNILLFLVCFYAVGYGVGYITGGVTWRTLYMLERIITVALFSFIPLFIFAVLSKAISRNKINKPLVIAAINFVPCATAMLVGFTDAVTRGFLTYFSG